MRNIKIQKQLKKDMLYLSVGFLVLVVLPISACIYHNLIFWFYALPCFLGAMFLRGFFETYMLYKTYKHKK